VTFCFSHRSDSTAPDFYWLKVVLRFTLSYTPCDVLVGNEGFGPPFLPVLGSVLDLRRIPHGTTIIVEFSIVSSTVKVLCMLRTPPPWSRCILKPANRASFLNSLVDRERDDLSKKTLQVFSAPRCPAHS